MPPRTGSSVTVAGRTLSGPGTVVGFAVVVALVGLGFSQLVPVAFFEGLDALGVSLPSLVALGVQLLLIELVGFGLATLAYLRLRGLPFDYVNLRWPTLRDAAWMVGGSLLVLVLYFGVVASAVALGAPLARSGLSVAGEANPDILLLVAVLSFLLVGPMEELFFRGIVQGTMREVLSATPAVVAASTTFAAIHYLTLVGPLAGKLVVLSSLFITSLVLGFAYERTGNLLVNAVVHGAYNAVLLVLAYVAFRSGLA
ncbi:CPBP family intramembrane glutamic endopeptidase [Halorarius halobius]|uniref:CPBP family intramembrane glutamic endopeptidase n=1 Tax=Halorarius halobius TaxID=2962671 RepID=UPI0020CCEF88|nr:type II CAAX endopeptidase family protein [Halorarius halobius]